MVPDLRRIIRRIHKVVEVGHLAAGQLHQRNGNLAVMHGSGGQHGTQGQTTIVHVQVQLEAVPGFRVPLGVLLDAAVADFGSKAMASWAD
jgi:hypothetical protein